VHLQARLEPGRLQPPDDFRHVFVTARLQHEFDVGGLYRQLVKVR